jgi:hypothetical protein
MRGEQGRVAERKKEIFKEMNVTPNLSMVCSIPKWFSLSYVQLLYHADSVWWILFFPIFSGLG